MFPAAHAEQMRLSLDELQSKYDRLKADFEQTLQNNETLKDVVQRLRQGNKNREVRKCLNFWNWHFHQFATSLWYARVEILFSHNYFVGNGEVANNSNRLNSLKLKKKTNEAISWKE